MKKIGIMTFHRADNLGAVLQAYALQTALKENWNTEAEIIDYQCSGVEGNKKKEKGLKGLLLQQRAPHPIGTVLCRNDLGGF